MTEKEILELLLQKVNEQGESLKEHTAILYEHSEILRAVRDAQEFQKAEIDRLNITTSHIEGELERIAGDVTFLVRKAAEHEDAIRELKRVK